MTLRCLVPALAFAGACADNRQPPPPQEEFARQRERMVAEQLAGRDIRDPRVLDAMRKVPRHQFVPAARRSSAYEDFPLPIGRDQTISQPYIVAYMTQALDLQPSHKVLEIGTGSGYQAAVLAELAAQVYTIEIVGELATRATETLASAGYRNVHVRHGDGYAGWPEHAPFDAIMVTAAPDHVPEPLIQQLAAGGRMIIPVGDRYQELRLIQKTVNGLVERSTIPVRFVPLTRIPR